MAESAKIFGRYELLRKIDSGGMGEIYLATMKGPHGFEKKVILKKIHPHLSRDEEFIKRFIDEGKLVVNLNHANIVQIFEMGIEQGEYFLTMEYVDGVNLSDFLYGLRKGGRVLPVELAVFILIEVLKGLSYAHTKTDETGASMGIIHRDISPVNIMISWDGEVKLLDFGVAKAKSRMAQSLPGVLHGKFLYLSPEQARGEELDFRSDIFSFGVTAYEMFTGTRPFEGLTDIEILDKIKNFPPPAICSPSFHGELSSIVMKCLEKDREKRYQSTAELEEAFVNYLYRTHTIVGRKEIQEFIRINRHLFSASQKDINGRADTPGLKKPSFDTKSIAISSYKKKNIFNRTLMAVSIVVAFLLAALALKFLGGPYIYPLVSVEAGDISFNEASGGATHFGKSFKPEKIEIAGIQEDLSKNSEKWVVLESSPVSSIVVRSNPEGSELYLNWKFIAKTPARLSFKYGESGRCELRAKGYKNAVFSCGYNSPTVLYLTLEKLKTGLVSFRFFPADAVLTINDKEIPTEGRNVVEYELPEGEYILKVASRDGGLFKTKKFTVKEGEKSILGTIDLTEKM